MKKYKKDKDEHLQRLRKALPEASFWVNQVRPYQTIDQARKILDTEFGDPRKLMDGLLKKLPILNQWRVTQLHFLAIPQQKFMDSLTIRRKSIVRWQMPQKHPLSCLSYFQN